MSFVIYNVNTTMLYRVRSGGVGCYKDSWATEAAAKAAMTRGKVDGKTFAIADAREFYNRIEKKETVRSLMGGGEVTQGVNTPACCDPSTETYWSM